MSTLEIQKTAQQIKDSDAVIVLAGAGMSADAGIPVYRGANGHWNKSIEINGASQPLSALNTHQAFVDNHELAWKHTKQRIETISQATPHEGYTALRSMLNEKERFVLTTNIDDLFEKAGFIESELVQVHGSLQHFQCMDPTEKEIWLMPERLNDLPPKCPECGGPTRPNIRLFEDWHWLSARSKDQERRYIQFIKNQKAENRKLVILEIGAGSTLPYLREAAEKLAGDRYPLVRINPFESEVHLTSHVGINLSAKEALIEIHKTLGSR